MLVIRLIRTGKKNAPNFRVILTEKTAPPKSGKFLEILGNYNPRFPVSGEKEISLKKERIKYWLAQGVQTSDTVHNLLVKQGVIKGPKIKKSFIGRKKKSEAGQEQETGQEQTEKEVKKDKKAPEKEEVKKEAEEEEKKGVDPVRSKSSKTTAVPSRAEQTSNGVDKSENKE